ncbi:hypothetical protein RB195_014035 [Necator americanus]|uniref:CWH43-like N-terminal domain-containing protein n=1 Tax=Necator americanus TaxID=51031 RepID=A0ABR1DYF1_NECAM
MDLWDRSSTINIAGHEYAIGAHYLPTPDTLLSAVQIVCPIEAFQPIATLGMEFSRKEAPRLYLIARKMLVVSGLGEVLFLSLLTVIGERESGDIHVLLFTAFAVFSYIYFVVMSLLTRWTYPGAEQESLRKKLQLGFLSAVTFTIPVIFVLFVLYNVLCVPTTYELFAIFEYATVAAIYGFHASSFRKMTGCIHIYHSNLRMHTVRV